MSVGGQNCGYIFCFSLLFMFLLALYLSVFFFRLFLCLKCLPCFIHLPPLLVLEVLEFYRIFYICPAQLSSRAQKTQLKTAIPLCSCICFYDIQSFFFFGFAFASILFFGFLVWKNRFADSVFSPNLLRGLIGGIIVNSGSSFLPTCPVYSFHMRVLSLL